MRDLEELLLLYKVVEVLCDKGWIAEVRIRLLFSTPYQGSSDICAADSSFIDKRRAALQVSTCSLAQVDWNGQVWPIGCQQKHTCSDGVRSARLGLRTVPNTIIKRDAGSVCPCMRNVCILGIVSCLI